MNPAELWDRLAGPTAGYGTSERHRQARALSTFLSICISCRLSTTGCGPDTARR